MRAPCGVEVRLDFESAEARPADARRPGVVVAVAGEVLAPDLVVGPLGFVVAGRVVGLGVFGEAGFDAVEFDGQDAGAEDALLDLTRELDVVGAGFQSDSRNLGSIVLTSL
jgi:hypothetical protein